MTRDEVVAALKARKVSEAEARRVAEAVDAALNEFWRLGGSTWNGDSAMAHARDAFLKVYNVAAFLQSLTWATTRETERP